MDHVFWPLNKYRRMIIVEMQQNPTIISAFCSNSSLNHKAIVNKISHIIPKSTYLLNNLGGVKLYLHIA